MQKARSNGLDATRIVVTVRPPATEAHYHNPESDTLFIAFMNRARAAGNVQVVLLPRNKAQERRLRDDWRHWFEGDFVVVPKAAVDGLNLLWHSDLLISGGGTMNREAAALGIPVYSIFRGPTGSVDRQLEREGRLVMVKTTDEVVERIDLRRRDRRSETVRQVVHPALATIVDQIELIVSLEAARDTSTTLGQAR
jgi:predicted glycosyltransferase